jgi:hypothetical protein
MPNRKSATWTTARVKETNSPDTRGIGVASAQRCINIIALIPNAIASVIKAITDMSGRVYGFNFVE